MRKFLAIATGALAIAVASPALAQNARSFVSAQGNDANSCSLATPCRTLQRAHNQTNAGGEINVLDTAGYGSLTITKAISIVNDGSVASALVPSGGTGITINAGVNDAVSLRGLTIEGVGVGQIGIQFNSGQLSVENCVVRHATVGLAFFPGATSSLTVSNSVFADNSQHGVNIRPSGSGTFTALFNRVVFNNNTFTGLNVTGAFSTGTISATVSESAAANNALAGLQVFSISGAAATTLSVFRAVAANNATGIVANGTGATLRIAQSMVTGNTNGWSMINGGVLLSDGDNTIEGNLGNEGAPTTYARK